LKDITKIDFNIIELMTKEDENKRIAIIDLCLLCGFDNIITLELMNPLITVFHL